MKDIQFNRSIPKDAWEELHASEIDKKDFSVRIYSAIRRAGYKTMGELFDSTKSELRAALQEVKRLDVYGVENVVRAIRDKAEAMGYTLPTDEEKRAILDALTETEQLQREINLLNQQLEILKVDNASLERQVERYRQVQREADERAYLEAREIAAEENALPKIIDRMQYIGSDGGSVPFCTVFALKEKGCALGTSYPFENESMDTICQKCMDKFLREYYKV